jgi:glutamine synthetase
VLRAVNTFQGLLRASIASAGNDHRLGANEAPPAIISVFLGEMLTEILDQIEQGGARTTRKGGMLDTGASVLPKLPRDAGDRNRTSPFAFTGNKFEFRAVSAGQSIAFPNIALNVAVTEALDDIATELEQAVAAGQDLDQAVKGLLVRLVNENKQVIFNGNGYSEEWRQEAGRRGLLNLPDTPSALPELVKPAVVRVFEKHRVLTERELRARYEINLEAYVKTVNVEAQLMVLIAERYLLPAAMGYQTQVAHNVGAVKAAGGSAAAGEKTLGRLCPLVDRLRDQTDDLKHALDHNGGGSAEDHGKHMRDEVIARMNALRDTGDQLELMVPSDQWPLPTYREMLFIK